MPFNKTHFSEGDGNILIGTSWEALLHWKPVRRAHSLQQQHQPHQNPLMNLASDISLVFTLVQRWSQNNLSSISFQHIYFCTVHDITYPPILATTGIRDDFSALFHSEQYN